MISVANKYHGLNGINIMRGSPLGNIFVIGKDGTREEVIEKYHNWLRCEYKKGNSSAAYRELMRLSELSKKQDITLVCCCKPKLCHGDIVKLAIEKIAQL